MLIPSGSELCRIDGDYSSWFADLSSSLTTLRQLAGSTENEFLQIGQELQDISQRSLLLSQTAHELVETASGDRLQALIARLRELFAEMNTYLDQARNRNLAGIDTLKTVADLLARIREPLSEVRKMCKHLYILEVSIKIESAYLGDTGGEFVNLAQDIKQLSQQTKEKANAIEDHGGRLKNILEERGTKLAKARKMEEVEAEATLVKTAGSLEEMVAASGTFSKLGGIISANSLDCSNDISTIVQSMQFHDIFRQQVEHVMAGLQGLLPVLSTGNPDELSRQAAISKAGDVCELQEAQLQYATEALHQAVASIVESLRAIGARQRQMSRDIVDQTGGRKPRRAARSNASFIAEVSSQMHAITGLLAASGANNRKISGIMHEVTDTVRQITAFVAAIEVIGLDIIQIALNARIKAAATGGEGASLSVLAAEIGQMSEEAVQRTDIITSTLNEIHGMTEILAAETKVNQESLSARLADIDKELSLILKELDAISQELAGLIGLISDKAQSLSAGIERLANGIKVHMHTKDLAGKVLATLRRIIAESRRVNPASAAFKDDLRQMAQRYTMESERRIHESIAGRHNIGSLRQEPSAAAPPAEESEFGDNVDLF